MNDSLQLAVVGGGPAGLRAAEVASAAGLGVTVFDAKPSVGRKFLIAGKGGLNLTHGEDAARFETRYEGPGQPAGIWRALLAGFDATAMREWAAGLGVETFQAGSGRVYPKALKAAPLLRRWVMRLKNQGVRFEMNHRCCGFTPGNPQQLMFTNGASVSATAVVFALGGGSWPQTGSDGAWLPFFESLGIACDALMPANCGWEHVWPARVLEAAEGMPLKNLVVHADGKTAVGELLLTRYGIEGGAIYQLGSTLRRMERPCVTIDFKPTFTHAQLVAKMESVRRDFLSEARVRWKLADAVVAILDQKTWHDAGSLAAEVKQCAIHLTRPRPIAEAISSAGGVCWSELDADLMLKKFPDVYVAGEMINWEAPTGGYLLQGCFATGTRVGRSVASRIG